MEVVSECRQSRQPPPPLIKVGNTIGLWLEAQSNITLKVYCTAAASNKHDNVCIQYPWVENYSRICKFVLYTSTGLRRHGGLW